MISKESNHFLKIIFYYLYIIFTIKFTLEATMKIWQNQKKIT